MKLKRLVLEAPLPREVQPTSTTWAQVVPSAQYTSDKAELDYDPTTALVRIKTPHSLRLVHVSRVLFMEPADELMSAQEHLKQAFPMGPLSEETKQFLATHSLGAPPTDAELVKAYTDEIDQMAGVSPKKKRGMPKGGWPKKVPPPVPGALEPPKDST